MKSGALRHYVTIQNPVDTASTGGDSTRTWVEAGKVWADIQELSALEKSLANSLQSIVTHKVTMRHTSIVTSDSKIVYGTRELTVVGPPILDSRARQITATCLEKR